MSGRHRGKARWHAKALTVITGAVIIAGAAGYASGRHSPVVPPPVSRVTIQLKASPAVTIPSRPVMYTVRAGDSLWSIAQQHCGSGTKWRDLQNLNHIGDPQVIPTGGVITLGCQ